MQFTLNKVLPKAAVSLFSLVGFLAVARGAFAAVPIDTVYVSSSVGDINTIGKALVFVTNLMRYIGWAGVILGVVMILALLIYKLIAAEDSDVMKKVTGGITKAVVIVIIGILLVSAGFIIEFVSNTLPGTQEVPTDYIETQIIDL